MLKPIIKFGNKTIIVMFEIIALIIFVLAIGFGAFVWKMSQGPVSISFAKEYVQSALSNRAENIDVSFDDLVLSWPDMRGRLYLDLKNLKITKGKKAQESLSIAQASVGLSRRYLLIGQMRPVSVIINAPTLELTRSKEGAFNLKFQDKEIAPEEKPAATQEIAQMFKDMAHNKGNDFLSKLDEFIIRDAALAVRDYQSGISWYLTDFDFEMDKTDDAITTTLKAALPASANANAGVSFQMVYRKESDDFKASARLQDLNPYVLSRFLPLPEDLGGQDLFLSGDIDIDLDAALKPTRVAFKGGIPKGVINIADEYDAPIEIKNLTLGAIYESASQKFAFSISSGNIGGIDFTGEGSGNYTDKNFSIPMQIKVPQGALSQLAPLIPKSEHEGEAYKWLGQRISSGNFSNVLVDMKIDGTKTLNETTQSDEWNITTPKLKVDFAFEGANVAYSDTLMPVQNTKGTGTLDFATQILEIKAQSGAIGDVIGSDISIKVDELLTVGAGHAYITLKAKGALSTALQYIAADPINMDKSQIGIDAKTVKGTITADVDISMPTLKELPKEQVSVKIKGTLNDVDIPDAVNGLPLSGGPLTLVTEEGGFRIKGNAKLAGRETVLAWHQYFDSAGKPYSMQVSAQIGADQELRHLFGVELDEYISGTMPVDVLYSLKDGNAQIDVKGDLNPMRVYIDPFKFEKPVGTPGTLRAVAILKNDVLKELRKVEVKTKDFTIDNGTIFFAPMNGKQADLSRGNLPSVTIGKSRVAVNFEVSQNNVMKVSARGPVFDMQPFLQEDETPQSAKPKKIQQAMNISLAADTIYAKNDQKINNAKTYIAIDTEGDITQLEMDAAVGTGPLYVRFRPDGTGKRNFRLESQDAGAVLKTFGLYDKVVGGNLLIYGEPKGGDLHGDLFGSMRMEKFKVVKAPALAKLLGLMSLTGVAQLLSNQGLQFEKLESDFEWRFQNTGNLLIVKKGKTSGSSIGLTFEGVVDRGQMTTNIAGTIIPMTEINSILSNIPLVGDILGGPGGLIAATYTMKGPSAKPEIAVNPLSVLAPGILRRILFEGGYESKIPAESRRGNANE